MIDVFSSETQEILEKAMEDTFEGIAFSQIFGHERQEAPVPHQGDELSAYIDLTEPMNTRLFFRMTREHAHECLSAVTDMDGADLEEAVIWDFVKELTNTVAGHFSLTLFPDKDDMNIGLPVNPDDSTLKACLTPSDRNMVITYEVEDFVVVCSLASL